LRCPLENIGAPGSTVTSTVLPELADEILILMFGKVRFLENLRRSIH